MAQLVARYLGVVEAASSSLVTQTKNTLKTLCFQGIFLCSVTQFFKGVLHSLPRSKGSRKDFDTRLGGLGVVLFVTRP